MAKPIIWSKEALADRIQILDYWYRRLGSKEYSLKLDGMFKEIVYILSLFPSLGRQIEGREERFFVKDHYEFIYLDSEQSIKILHIWDSRRDPSDFPVQE